MSDICSFILISFLLELGFLLARARWFYKDGKIDFNHIVKIELVSFVLQELFLLFFVFNGGGVLDSTTIQEDNTILGKIKKFIFRFYD
ncbi:MAG: hypothetical protein J6Y30_11490 [Treponema sp.]|nr:hypothetical protein [Treponema sp.]